MATTSNHYIVILCGGTGPRLWPLSHANYPKQFLPLFRKKTLLEQTISRAKKICPLKNIYLVSNQHYRDEINKIIGKKFLSNNILYEPTKKNTAMAILFAISKIQKQNSQAIVTTMPSDHFIRHTQKFKKNILNNVKLTLRYHQIISLGIKPTYPNVSYGYILPQQKNKPYSIVSLFIEKPDITTAQNLIKKGAFWNSGIYTFTIPDMVSEFEKLQPQYYILYQKLINSDFSNIKTINDIYNQSLDLPIDRAISEKSKNMFVVPVTFDWSDVGEWKSLYQQLNTDDQGHAIINNNTEILSVDSKNCLINGSQNKLISLVGVSNTAVIDTNDSLLICNLDQSSKVRDLISLMVKKHKYKQYFLKK